jgi:plasmid stabilization system protein ParE
VSRLKWTLEAIANVRRLHRFLADKDAAAASRAVSAIRSGLKVVAFQPQIGRPVEDSEAELREWLIDFGSSGYVALYRVDDSGATILAVRHQKEVGY